MPQSLRSLVDGAHASLGDDVRAALGNILMEYADTFSLSAMDLGCMEAVTHHIDTGYLAPHVEVISRQVDNMLAQGVIEPACKPFGIKLGVC